MQEQYDVLIVGSGIGGLGAGAFLSRWGYKTLVVEKRSIIGGRYSTEEYEGFKLPTGGLVLHRDFGIPEVFAELGLELDLVPLPENFYRLEGKDYRMPTKGAIPSLLDIADKLEVDRAKLVGGLTKAVATQKVMEAFKRGTREPAKETLTFRDWLLQYTDSDLAHSFFDTIINTLCAAHIYEIPASAVFSFMVRLQGFRNISIPRHGLLVEMEKLVQVVKANGDVWTNCPAKRIVVQGGRARGIVVAKDGSEVEISGQVMISDVGPKATVGLAGMENFDEEYLKLMRMTLRPHPVTMTFVASDRPLWPEGGEPATLQVVGARRITSVVPISNVVPEAAPPGQHLLFAFGGPVSNEVHMNIEEEQRQITLDIKEQFPLFEKHGKILKIDSRDIDHEFPEMRTRVGYGMPPETPIKNLFNVGDAMLDVGLSGGVAAAESGMRVARIVRKSFKPGKA